MLLLALLSTGCSTPAPAPQTEALVPAATPEPSTAPGLPPTAHGHGATLYVPVYSSVYIAEGNQTFDLTVTLTIRNTSREHPISVVLADYYDTAGKPIHAYVEAPTELSPLASADIVVRESDTRAGVGGSFVVQWRAEADVSDPVVQAVMIGSGYQQGISFLSEGRVLERASSPEAVGQPTR